MTERSNKDIIKSMREVVKPFIGNYLKRVNDEGMGDADKAEFETEFEKVLTLAEKAEQMSAEIKGEDRPKATLGEYIKKADMEKILYSTNNAVRIGEEFLELPTYAIPKATPPGEYIKKADALRIARVATFSVDQTVSIIKALSTYSIPDSAKNKGEWIDNGNGSYTCSNCKTEWTTSQIEKMRFCPTCGEPKAEKGN